MSCSRGDQEEEEEEEETTGGDESERARRSGDLVTTCGRFRKAKCFSEGVEQGGDSDLSVPRGSR